VAKNAPFEQSEEDAFTGEEDIPVGQGEDGSTRSIATEEDGPVESSPSVISSDTDCGTMAESEEVEAVPEPAIAEEEPCDKEEPSSAPAIDDAIEDPTEPTKCNCPAPVTVTVTAAASSATPIPSANDPSYGESTDASTEKSANSISDGDESTDSAVEDDDKSEGDEGAVADDAADEEESMSAKSAGGSKDASSDLSSGGIDDLEADESELDSDDSLLPLPDSNEDESKDKSDENEDEEDPEEPLDILKSSSDEEETAKKPVEVKAKIDEAAKNHAVALSSMVPVTLALLFSHLFF
jgi:hypothetical protein